MKYIVGSLAICLFAVFTTAQAHAATVSVIHGIDGRDLDASQALSVDISVNGACALTAVKFKDVARVEFAAGNYGIKIHLSDGKCGQAAVIDKTVAVTKKQTDVALLASLDRNGAPQLLVIDNSVPLFSIPTVALQHAAVAGPVSVTITNNEVTNRVVKRIVNGGRPVGDAILTGRGLTFRIVARNAANGRALFTRVAKVPRKTKFVYYIVGSAKNGLTVISERIALK